MPNLIRNKWLPFKKARAYVRNTNIKTEMEWKYKRKNLPSFIPRDPHVFYKKERMEGILRLAWNKQCQGTIKKIQS